MTSEDLFKAITEGDRSFLRSLLANGCDPDACRRDKSVLIHAVIEDQSECVSILIEYDVTIDRKDHVGMTAAMYACCYKRHRILALLLESGSNLKAIAHNGMTACMLAAQHKSLNCLRFILDSVDVDLNGRDCDGNTAITYAVKNENQEGIDHLLAKGADMNVVDDKKQSPLHHAIKDGALSIARMLIDKGAHLNIQDKWGNTPLATAFEFVGHASSMEGFELIKLFLLNGAEPSIQMCNTTYLHEMVVKKQLQIVRLMVIKGFRPVDVKCTSEAFYFDSILKAISPFAVALLSNSVNIAKYFVANSFLTRFDVNELPNDRTISDYLSHQSYTQCIDLMTSMFSTPLHLVTLSLVTISDTWLIAQERQLNEYINYIKKFPNSIKDKLFYRTKTALLCSSTWSNIPLNFDIQNSASHIQNKLSWWPLRASLAKCKCVLCEKSQGYKPIL